MVISCQEAKTRYWATNNITELETLEVDLRGMTDMQCSDPANMRQTGSQTG